MSEGIPFGDIIIIGAVALFIILRYRSILGSKTGHDFSQRPKMVVNKPDQDNRETAADSFVRDAAPTETELALTTDPRHAQAIAKIKNLDPDFTTESFLSGARIAYEMVVDAANKQDRDTLKMLLAKEVYDSFDADISAQESSKKIRHTTLVALKSAEMTDITLRRQTAQVTVQFMSEQITVVRDDSNAIVEGNPSDVDDVVDEWVFERDLKSRNPNWLIVAT